MTENGLPPGWARAYLDRLVQSSLGGMWGTDPARGGTGGVRVRVVRGAEFRAWDAQRASSAPVRVIPAAALGSRRLQVGDIVLEVSGGGPTQPVGRTILVDDAALRDVDHPLICSNFCRRLVVSTEVDGRFLSYQLQASYAQGHTDRFQRATTNIRNLQVPDYLASTTIALAPFAEQQRIVAAIEEELSRMDAGTGALESAAKRLANLRSSVLEAAVLGRLVPQDPADEPATGILIRTQHLRTQHLQALNGRSGSSIPYDRSGLPELPGAWVWASLDEIADVVGGVTKDSKRKASQDDVEVPYLRVANVQRGYLALDDVAAISVPRRMADALMLQPDDVLFNEGGDRDKLGRGWIWEGQIDKCIHQNHVFRARLYTQEIDPRIISWHGNTFGRSWFMRTGKQTTNLASVNRTTLRSFPIPIPPRAEQARIRDTAERWLTIIDSLDASIRAEQRRTMTLRSSILAAAFSGRLVPQNPTDEPASVLLQRIETSTVKSNGAPRPGRTKVTA